MKLARLAKRILKQAGVGTVHGSQRADLLSFGVVVALGALMWFVVFFGFWGVLFWSLVVFFF